MRIIFNTWRNILVWLLSSSLLCWAFLGMFLVLDGSLFLVLRKKDKDGQLSVVVLSVSVVVFSVSVVVLRLFYIVEGKSTS